MASSFKLSAAYAPGCAVSRLWAALSALLLLAGSIQAGLLSASLAPVAQGSNVNLTEIGKADWVHWGLYNETSINRKAGVTPQISDFTLLDAVGGFSFVFPYADNYNGYSWTDGDPEMVVNNTPTGVWAYGTPLIGSGFRVTVPAGLETMTFKIFVGAYACRGHFTAFLSDGSAPSYSNTSVSNIRNGPGGVYTIQYAANAPGQTLTVEYTLATPMAADGNVTLQAATLSTAESNNPPVVSLFSPVHGANISAGSDVILQASAIDLDGSVQMVEFFAGETKLGQDDSDPYEAAWNGVQPGLYLLTAVATDDGGARMVSRAVEIFVHGTGGSLAGNTNRPPASVDLTAQGTTDWVHWGLSSLSVENRKAIPAPQISPLTVVGADELQFYQNNFTSFQWSDGTPTVSTSGLPHGVFVYGLGNGFELRAPADTTARRLKVYAGLYGAASRMQAYLSDFSAMAYGDQSLSNAFDDSYVVYTFDYAAASPGQQLIVRYLSHQLFDHDYGNVTLQAATLQGGEGPTPVELQDPRMADGAFLFSFASQSGWSYQIQRSPLLDPGGWTSNQTVTGTGDLVTITNQTDGQPMGFYRVLSH